MLYCVSHLQLSPQKPPEKSDASESDESDDEDVFVLFLDTNSKNWSIIVYYYRGDVVRRSVTLTPPSLEWYLTALSLILESTSHQKTGELV